MAEQELQIALGIQKPTGSTNLGEETAALLIAGGLRWKLPNREDFAPTSIKGLEIVTMRNRDLTRACARGEIDIAIVGRDKYWDYEGPNVPVILKELGYSQCTVKLGVSPDFPYTKPEDLKNQTIATSYVRGSARWFRERRIPININEYDGGEEIGTARFWRRTKAVACIAVSDTGTSMIANKANPVMDILKSEAILIANPDFANQSQGQQIMWRILRTVMTGIWQTQYALLKFNYPESKESEIMQKTPSSGESPTKMLLDETGWKAAETLIPINNRESIESNLLESGARDLFYSKVERMIPNFDDPEVTRMMRVIYGQDWQLPNPPYPI